MNRPVALRAELEGALGVGIEAMQPVAGGDIADSYAVEPRGAERIFVKDYGAEADGISKAEALGLGWLAEADALSVPAVIGLGPGWLALEWIEAGPPGRSNAAEALGRGLAALHRTGAPAFGAGDGAGNWIATLPQDNTPEADWATFYRVRRLEPLLAHAQTLGVLPRALRRRFDLLFEGFEDRVGPAEPPARLHGDLWRGNVLFDLRQRPWLIDPAAYGGAREVDLAMMRLFGGFDERTFAAYQEVAPLPAGHSERIALYQLLPLLVHVCLFGGSYVASLSEALDRALEAGAGR